MPGFKASKDRLTLLLLGVNAAGDWISWSWYSLTILKILRVFRTCAKSILPLHPPFLFWLFRATPMAYGGSQARGSNRSYSCQPQPQPQQCQIQAASVTYTTAHSNTGPLTHWARPGIEPVYSWLLVRFVSAEPWEEVLSYCFH